MMYEAINHFTEPTISFILQLRNLVKFAELIKVLNKKNKTIFDLQNLKSFGTEMGNL
jgi:hypothetical protein